MYKMILANNLNPYESYEPWKFNIELPHKCPCCDVAYSQEPVSSFFIEYLDSDDIRLYSIYFCPHCEECFFIQYFVETNDLSNPLRDGTIAQTFPETKSISTFPKNVSSLSPKFVSIYNQSESAENSGLFEICGMGYRKSLEFLVKDFAIHKFPNDSNTIKSQPLSACIKKYILADNIRTLLERTTWIGNDETHYIRKHEDRNFSDMKNFIRAIVYFIEMTLITDDAASMIPKK